MAKKCSTDQRFIWKRNTTYKIHTLVNYGNCKYFFKIMKKCWSHFRTGQQIQPGWSTFCLILCFWPSFYSQNGISDQKYGSEIFVQKKRADNTKFDTNLTIQTVHRFEMLTKYDTNIMKYIDWHIKGRNQNLTYSFRQRENYLVNYLSSILIILVI